VGEIEVLCSLASQVAIAIQQGELLEQLEQTNQKLHDLAISDALTGLANRRYFDQYLQQEWQRLKREQQSISMILGDVDFFKKYNDTYGHQMGDQCLQTVAEAIQACVKRPADLVARYGGEEFAVILPNTDLAGALLVAKEIKTTIEDLKISHFTSEVNQYVTISLGIACVIPNLSASQDILIKAADDALYSAKNLGRNRIEIAELEDFFN
jgi:diguanylate cyclase (GGDEF)-like protein